MADVDLGYSEPCENWKLQSKFFPSKIGGKPAWLDLEGVPSGDDISCLKCNEPMTFLCQVYAPYEEDENNFHRTVFLFVCRKTACHTTGNESGVVAFRSNIKRRNKFYSYDPPSEEPDLTFSLKKWLNLCEVCGCVGTKKCSKCSSVYYCSKPHQVIDWKEKHKNSCGRGDKSDREEISPVLYPESEIVIEPEELDKNEVNEEHEKEKYLDLVKQGKCGTMIDANDEELGQFSAQEKDVTFSRFRERVDLSPDQVLRYDRGGKPLMISDEGIPETIPNCEYCGGPRQFEFQVMPQLLWVIKERDIDWGILMCYSCVNSCTGGANYKREYVCKQNVSAVDLTG